MNWFSLLLIALLPACICNDAYGQDKQDAKQDARQGVADRLLEDLQGEAIKPTADEQSHEAPRTWHSIAQEMDRVARQLPDQAASRETLAAQSALIKELERLLEQSSQNAGTSSSTAKSPSNQDRKSSSKTAPPSDGDSEPGAKGDGPAAKAGGANSDSGGASRAASLTGSALVRKAWGQLPGRVREKLQSSSPEKFHAKYQSETENYFRRLSELEHRP